MHQALYRKWRPRTFSDVCGQEHITSVLKYEILTGKTSHAYLFCGSRGTGKTTCAKILAKALNCLAPVNGEPCGSCAACLGIDNGSATDVLELDAASNNGVDNIRDIRDEVAYTPAMLRNRVYIIDEVHMLSASAFNALLKTLEEPPPQVVFILATTELQKIPATILSRCQRFDFRRLSVTDITARLAYIAENEKITLEPEAARIIARLSQGGMRDAISLFELCSGENGSVVDARTVSRVAGVCGRDEVARVYRAVAERDYEEIFAAINGIFNSSLDISVFWSYLIEYCRDMLIIKSSAEPAKYLELTQSELEQTRTVSKLFSREDILYQSKQLDDAYIAMSRSLISKRLCAELTLVRLCDASLSDSTEAMLARIARLENAVAEQRHGARAASAVPEEDRVPDAGDAAEEPEPFIKTRAAEDGRGGSDAAEAETAEYTDWADVVKRVGAVDSGASGMLQLARAYRSGGYILITVENGFLRSMLSSQTIMNSIASAISAVEGTPYSAEDIKIEIVPSGREMSKNGVDDINI